MSEFGIVMWAKKKITIPYITLRQNGAPVYVCIVIPIREMEVQLIFAL